MSENSLETCPHCGLPIQPFTRVFPQKALYTNEAPLITNRAQPIQPFTIVVVKSA